MGLLQDLAAAAIRKQVVAALRADCPDALHDALETLLADAAAVGTLQKIVMAALGAKRPLDEAALAPLQLQPELAAYLCTVANAKMPHGASFGA